MTTLWYVLIGISIIALFIYNYIDNKPNLLNAIIAKGTCSLLFVIMGIYCFAHSNNKLYSTLILVGLILGAVADIFIDLSGFFKEKKHREAVFMLGAFIFFIGHIFYNIALSSMDSSILPYSVIVCIILAAIILPIIAKLTTMKLAKRIASTAYFLTIGLVVGSSYILSVKSTDKLPFILFAIASTLFLSSDIVLTVASYGKGRTPKINSFILFTYYLAQFLIANTILLIS